MASHFARDALATRRVTAPATSVAHTGPATERRPTVIIEPTRGWSAINLKELWVYRDLLMILAGRDVKLRYKQTGLGVTWVVLQPLVAALIFSLMFGRFAKLPSDGHPYLLFVFSGILVWQYFASVLQRAGNSLITDQRLITKVYFPRLAIPLASTFSALIDLGVGLVVLAVFMGIYGIAPTWRLLALPGFVVLTALTATGVSLWLSALNVKYRDFAHATPFLLQVWMFASPVAYATSIVPERWRVLYSFNPAVAFIEGARWSILGTSALDPRMVVIAAVIGIAVFIAGAFFFRRVERGFADAV
ncbi:MAG TPA: ABC transporter permease [Gemmatimonadaceae bacterium]|nr:ABC transporter permease [Gemmatimonadaceae bacterium]